MKDVIRETTQCQNCKNEFRIESEDFKFYEKISVPAPTWCPECRMKRRMAFRNERSLYPRRCDLCKKDVIAIYPEKVPFPVYCQTCWWSDKWDAQEYAQDFNASRPFFEQFKELQTRVPRPHTANYAEARLINSLYTNCAGDLKNCYLVFGALKNEDCAYSHYIDDSRDCFDTFYCIKSEGCYESLDLERCYNVFFSQSCAQCSDSLFLFDCRNCSNCIGSNGLRNKSYYIFNKPYTKEEYKKKKAELDIDSYKGLMAFKGRYEKEMYFSTPRKFYHGQMNNKFSGDYLANTENTYHAFFAQKTRDVKFIVWCVNAQDVYDYFGWGDVELCYEAVACGDKSYGLKFTHTSWSNDRDIEYSNLCFSSAHFFGCIGLRSKKYAILNKQYSENEYETLVSNIKEQMNAAPYEDKKGRMYAYGEFFPPELSPFSYHDTVAQEYFPLSREKAMEEGYVWREPEKRELTITIESGTLPDRIGEVAESIGKEIIGCAHKGKCEEKCAGAFRIIPQELAFYRKNALPLPRLCSNCRYGERIKKRNPLKLWQRRCQCNTGKEYKNTVAHFHGEKPCPNEFETSYAPERKEIMYCEKCYLAEVA